MPQDPPIDEHGYVKIDVLAPLNPAHVDAYIESFMKMGTALAGAWKTLSASIPSANHAIIEMYTYRFKDDRIPAVEPSDAEPIFWPPNESLDAWACSRQHRDHRDPHRVVAKDIAGTLLLCAVVVLFLYALAKIQSA